ncbi:MAG: class I SAM-dependent methyltransferase [Candidatus Parvarchaeota archaeon]|nr:class I SAM-dependent methyltransferase [Candidatus Rehaiarchaeum fermentans]MCW1293409.1 class I SAM-dependent methyltransferase [Candidatus Rehaiarchaeum fermentans]
MNSIAYYNSISKSYEKLYKAEQIEKLIFISTFLNLIRAKEVLDVGAGTGLLEELNPHISFIVLEPSRGMLNILESKKLKNIKDICNCKLEDFQMNKKFDAATSVTVLQDIEEKDRINFIYKLLRLGTFVILTFLKASNIRIPEELTKYLLLSKEISNDYVFIFKGI